MADCIEFKLEDLGVPQGSILGPILFSIGLSNINCHPLPLETKYLVYANDILIWKNCMRTAGVFNQYVRDVISTLESALCSVDLKLNQDKTKIMICNATRVLKHPFNKCPVSSLKILGYMINRIFSERKLLEQIVAKVRKAAPDVLRRAAHL